MESGCRRDVAVDRCGGPDDAQGFLMAWWVMQVPFMEPGHMQEPV